MVVLTVVATILFGLLDFNTAFVLVVWLGFSGWGVRAFLLQVSYVSGLDSGKNSGTAT